MGLEALGSLAAMEVAEEVIDPKEAAREAWMAKRSGRVTGSNFGDLIGTGNKGVGFTQKGITYLNGVVAERMGSFSIGFKAASTEFGNTHESGAMEAYETRTGQTVQSGEFQFVEFGPDIGATPDGLVGLDGCIEIKCPKNPAVHVNTAITRVIPKEYEWQVHGHLFVTGRDWCDFISFDPRVWDPKVPAKDQFGLVIIRQERDEAKLAILADRLAAAVTYVRNTVGHLGGLSDGGKV